MTSNLLLNQVTKKQIELFRAKPSHALMLIGASGAGKHSLGRAIAAGLLAIELERLDNQPFFFNLVKPDGKQNISIESIRELIKFLRLKVPSAHATNRVVLIEDAQDMTHEAQNALLKSLEEPPAGTVFILTTVSDSSLLPTISSRTTKVSIRPIARSAAMKHFSSLPTTEVESAWRLSQGLPGLLCSLLSEESHELKSAVSLAKKFMAQNTYERLLQLDSISLNKHQFSVFLIGLGKVLQALYKSPSNNANVARLTRSMDLVLTCRRDLELNVSPRLISLRLALNLSV